MTSLAATDGVSSGTMNRRVVLVFWTAITALTVGVVFFPHLLWEHFHVQNHYLHIAMEMWCAIAALMMGLFLLLDESPSARTLVYPALGFVAMGTLNIAHALTPFGNNFVLFYQAMIVAGGTGFALSYVPSQMCGRTRGRIAAAVVAACALFAFVAGARPTLFPDMLVQDGHAFTRVAIVMSFVAAALYAAGTIPFLR